MARTILLRKISRLLKIAVQKERATSPNTDDWSRRDFLQVGMLGVSLPGLLAACQTPALVPAKSPTPIRDITVVGAGTAGLTCAYSMAKAGLACGIYEASSRVGGRMMTSTNFNSDGMFCELGGEFVDTQHEDLIKLCQELGLGIENLAPDEQHPLREVYFSRGQLRSEKQIIAAFKPLAKRLLKDIALLSPKGELQIPNYQSELAKISQVITLDRQSLSQYVEKSGIDAWLRDLISNAYQGEYGLDAGDQSALNLVVLISAETKEGFKIFGSSDEAKRITGGSEALPKALAKAVQSTSPIEFEHKLLAVREDGGNLKLIFDHQGKTVEVISKRIVLALPAGVLKDVDLKSLDLSPVKRRAIAEWGFGTNSKLMLGFQKRVWEKSKIPQGFSLTPDQRVQEFWDTSRGQKGSQGIITNFLGGSAGLRIDPQLPTQSLDFLEQIFPGTKSAYSGKKILQHWPSQALTRGSYTSPRPGQYTSIYGAFAEPELQGRMIFAGEHCSTDWSGFMNGAVQSGKSAAELLIHPA